MKSRRRVFTSGLIARYLMVVSAALTTACVAFVSRRNAGDASSAVRGFLLAAASHDTVEMAQWTVGDSALNWVRRWRGTYPSYFERAADKPVVESARYMEGPRSPIVVLVRVDYVSCAAPVHAGTRDVLAFYLVRVDDRLRIRSVRRPIC
jgi:hypothetical protein